MAELVADINKWNFVHLKTEGIDEETLKLIPEDIARKQKILAFSKDEQGIKIAMTNPGAVNYIHLLQKKLGKRIIPFYALEEDINSHLSGYRTNIQEEFEEIIKSHASEAVASGENESSTVKIVNMLLERAYENGASDIHIEPNENDTLVRFRIDGMMTDIIRIPKNAHNLLISRIKVMSHLRIDEHQQPQDGKLRYQNDRMKMDVRVSILPTTTGENSVMRLLSEKSSQKTLEDLGFSDHNFELISRSIAKPWGMILATGPTGSGKTTTLYAILKVLNKRTVNIATIEDPVEYSIDGITQIQVNHKADLTFATGLRSLVRQDPDIIMIGEIRDSETSQIAVNSAMTGHLVLSTLHTNDAPTALPRLLDMGIEPFLVASTVNIIVAQRLVRRICTKCIQSYEMTKDELAKKLPPDILEKLMYDREQIIMFKGVGCKSCNKSGYSGRSGVYEILEVDDDIRELIIKNAATDQIRNKAVENGMTTMFDDARESVLQGITTLEEMIRVVKQ